MGTSERAKSLKGGEGERGKRRTTFHLTRSEFGIWC
jgi:hypothetical protein